MERVLRRKGGITLVRDDIFDLGDRRPGRVVPDDRVANPDVIDLDARGLRETVLDRAHAVLAGHAFNGELEMFHDLGVVMRGVEP